MSQPRVKLFCFFYNEAVLLPFFLSHYQWADCLHAFVSKSTDGTREILEAWKGFGRDAQSNRDGRAPHRAIEIEDFEFPAGMDDLLKTRKLNESIVRKQDADWLIVLDADEFIWPGWMPGLDLLKVTPEDMIRGMGGERLGVKTFLRTVPDSETVLVAKMWNVFRHETDGDLEVPGVTPGTATGTIALPETVARPVVLQRRHGIADRAHPENCPYQKPIIIRANMGIQFVPGNHAAGGGACHLSQHTFDGAHWVNADPAFAVARRCRDRRDRQSESNRRLGLGAQHHYIKEADVVALCEAHKQDPICF